MNRKTEYRDMDKWRASCKVQRKRYYSRLPGGFAQNSIWSDDENRLVLKHDRTDRELSAQIGRSVQAIQVQRCRLKKRVRVY